MDNGFTLIELMIVVVIIGILAAIAIPKFSDVSESASRNACRANIRTICAQEVVYFARNLTFAGDLAELGMSGVICPSSSLYGIQGLSEEYTVSCLYTPSHGNIADGVASWHDSQ